MKFRLGQLTGTPDAKDAASAAGCYFSLDDSREGLTGLAAIHYADGKGKCVKIWPGEGMHRITALQLGVDPVSSALLNRYALSSDDFMAGNAFLQTMIKNRVYSRSKSKAQILWETNSNTLRFLRNSGPFADALLRGDYVTLEVGMDGWTKHVDPEVRYDSLIEVAPIQPVTTCDVTVRGGWNPEGDDGHGAAAVLLPDGTMKARAEGGVSYKKKKGFLGIGGSVKRIYHYNAASLRGFNERAALYMAGPHGARSADITFPPQRNVVTAKILNIEIQQ